jgi:hypothetical protein
MKEALNRDVILATFFIFLPCAVCHSEFATGEDVLVLENALSKM